MRAPWFACLPATALLLAGCSKQAAPPEPVLVTVRTGPVEQVRSESPERYAATILPVAQVDLAFKSAGLIEKIYQVRGADGRVRDIQAGDQIAEGVELAVVRRLDFEQRVQQAQDQIGQAEAQLAQAEAASRQAELDFARATSLYNSASLIKPDYDQAKARAESTAAQVRGAQSALGNARTTVNEAKLSLSDTSVRAPFTGWITARNVQRGSLVGNATVGFSMVDTHVVKAVFAVPDISLKSIRLGQHLSARLDALDRAVTGIVTSISPEADPKTHVFSVEVSIPNPKGEIRPGMIGALTLGPATEPKLRQAVPLSAVVREPGTANGFAVFLLQQRDGKSYVSAREITVGSTFGNSIEVTHGLAAGERIVVLGGELLRNGQEVRVLQ